MKIELLYPETNNHLGEKGHMDLLHLLFPEALFFETPLVQTPAFTKEKMDLIYLGAGTEKSQEQIINYLRPKKDYLVEAIENETPILLFGNSSEVLFNRIDDIEGLGIFDYTAKRQMLKRINSIYHGRLIEDKDLEVVAFRSQFTQIYSEGEDYPLFETIRGLGRNSEENKEGILYKNLFATHLIGPVFIMNPLLLQWYLKRIGRQREIPNFDTMMEAYELRKKEYLDPKTMEV